MDKLHFDDLDELIERLRFCAALHSATSHPTNSKLFAKAAPTLARLYAETAKENARLREALDEARAETSALVAAAWEGAAKLADALAKQHADLALDGLPEQARLRESMEAAFTKAAAAIRASAPTVKLADVPKVRALMEAAYLAGATAARDGQQPRQSAFWLDERDAALAALKGEAQ